MKKGTIIRTKDSISNDQEPIWKYCYWVAKEGDFTITDSESDYTYKFSGIHFTCLGHEYFMDQQEKIAGIELLDNWYEIVESAPMEELNKNRNGINF